MNSSLKGLGVLNTRPGQQAQGLSKKIAAAGGLAIDCPTIAIQAMDALWLQQLPDLNEVEYAIFVSANAVYYCFENLKLSHITWPKQLKTIAIGQGTAKALREYDIDIHAMPAIPDSEHLLELPSLQQVNKKILLLFKGEGGRPLLEKELIQRGARLMTLLVYKRILPQISPQYLNTLWRDNRVDIILLTSEQSIFNLFKLFDKEAHDWLQNKTCLVISKRLAQSAKSLGMKKIIISHPAKIMDALFDYSQGFIND